MSDVKAGETAVVAGTRKGLFVFHSPDRRGWKVRGPYFEGRTVKHAVLDPRDGRTLYAGVTTGHWGPIVYRTTDCGEEWTRGTEGPHFPKGSDLSVESIWHVEPGTDGDLWLGVEPAGLFRSEDEGDTWTSVAGLNDREDRGEWQPGAGGLCLHTVLPYPGDPKRMVVGISAVGVLGTNDGGASWRVMNGRIRGVTSPDESLREDQIGSCVHKMVRDAADPAVLYQQNHAGVYRRTRGDSGWTAIEEGLPSTFGFPMAAHPHKAGTVYAVPLVADANRVTPNAAMAVYRTTDGGSRWDRLSRGLPQEGAYFTILREGLCTDQEDPAGVYVGTKTGQLYVSRDEGASWDTLSELLPPVLSLEATTVGGA